MDTCTRARSSQTKPKVSVKKDFTDGVLRSVKSLLQSRKELCNVSTEESLRQEEQDNFIEITFLSFAGETDAAHMQELAAVSVELPDVLKSLHFCSLNENEIIFLKDINKPLETSNVPKHQIHLSGVLCVMRLSPSLPRIKADSVFTLLSKYATGVRYTMEVYSLQKHETEMSHAEDDDTNQSVSSIEDDFVTAFEHLDEDETSKIQNTGTTYTTQNHRDAASQTIPAHCLEDIDSKIIVSSGHRKSSAKSSASLINILGLKELPSSVKNSVTTSISDPWIQRSFYKPCNSSDQRVNVLHKTLFSSSPAESSESDCSSPSPVIFLDEEGYQKSLKAKLQLPKIPVVKDGIEDSDSEVSEFFDSFDQFDELEQTLESTCKLIRDPILGNQPQKRKIALEQLYSKTNNNNCILNPQKFKFDRPTLPANVRKPTPRKPESPYNSLFDVPDSPRPVKTGEDNGGLFSPIRSSAFSPLGSCASTECLCRMDINGDGLNQNHDTLYSEYSDYANNVSFEILGSVFHSHSTSLQKHAENISSPNKIVSKKEKAQIVEFPRKTSEKEPDKKVKSKNKSLTIKDSIQKFATELVEKSFGNAFKDLQKGVSSCTSALCHLAVRLTSSVFQMAFYEIGRRRALSLKERAINGLASFLVSEAITSALKELRYVKKQIFTNTVAKFAADLTEELIFEGLMEVCQFSHPSTPAAAQDWAFDYEDKVVRSYAKDLSESVIQEAFIELSQVDVTFTTQAAISVSMDNIKYVSAESTLQSTQTTTAFPNFRDSALLALNPIQETGKEYTVQQALFCTSGVVSSIPVPLAGTALCQHQTDVYKAKVWTCPTADGSLKMYKDSTQPCFTTKKREEEVASLRNIYLTADHSEITENSVQCFCNQNDFKQTNNNPGANNISELTTGPTSINSFSGTMVDMIVNEAYEAITSSRITGTVEEYTDFVTRKTPRWQCVGGDIPKNTFADHLSKYIVKQSVDETKSIFSHTSETVECNRCLQMNTNNCKKELSSAVKKQESEKHRFVPIIVEPQQLSLNNPPKFLVTSDDSAQCLLSVPTDCVQEHKGHEVRRFSSSTPSPCPTGTLARCNVEEFTDSGSRSIKSQSKPLKTHDMQKTMPSSSAFGQESCFLHASNLSLVMFGCEDSLQMEDKSSIRDGNVCTVPYTPPPTPLVPSQTSSEWNLRKLTKKLKGELAKEFAPVTPPSTPYNSSAAALSATEHDFLEKEEFMLKLMRSLSEEVESSEDGEHSEMLVEKTEHSEKTVRYADHLAGHIISVATEMAASHLDDKTIKREADRHYQLNAQNKICGYTAFINIPEETLHSLWNYAGDMAGKVINEAKKMIKSRHCKLLKLKRVNCHVDCLSLRKDDRDCKSKERWCPVVNQWSREVDSSVLSLPGTTGLTSRYPSCESVTDEYADHIIRVLKREGGNSELIMDQYASRLAYRSIKSGLQQAARKIKLTYNRTIFPVQKTQVNGRHELFKILNKDMDTKWQMKSSVHRCGGQPCEINNVQRTEGTELLHFSESLAHPITCDVRRKLKMSAVCLPKSLTDSCLYRKSKFDEATGDLLKTTLSKTVLPFSQKHKLYHSTGSLNEYGYREGIIQAIEEYARKVVDDTLEMSLESAVLQPAENRKNGDRFTYTEKLSPFSGTACRYCSMKEYQCCTGSSSPHLPGQELLSRIRQIPNSGLGGVCQKSRIFHLDIPKIHIDMEQKTVFSEKVVGSTIEKAERELSNTSLAADSGIGHGGVSFAESLTTEIMTSAMTNIGQAVNISSMGREGFHSAESVVSQQMSLSIGDDSTGSWSNLSFEDEHPDESSSFLHLSDSDGTEDKDEDARDSVEDVGQVGKALLIVNVDMEPHMVDPQLRTTLQWLAASETEVSELCFHDTATKEFILLTKRLRERDWKVGDLLQAVLKYCEMMEKTSDGDRLLNKPLFGWLLENV
ncbi:A-kinase anchor protein 11 isoform X2 [Dermochelys coriacea]|uniref:A-kinase anchor protein 11 isoform X2 n=1 Tax=Dermochelys coriacea TaxID=27794 RepID=UPI0018E84F9D|nr:A-kinase anchor protein 11 isoform X2 [Dermochelys coriacea]XP_043360477.1 A-kinase anchor protein 11 isoform X2 [Dermochelys coriacea]